MIPVEKNKEYTVRIETVSSEGDGVGRIDGFTVFVPYAAPGDLARILIVKCKAHYAYGKLIELLEPSAQRQEPACEKFGVCGGCRLMHLQYGAQLELKKQAISDALQKIGGVEVERIELYGMDHPFRYRNKMIFPVGKNRQGETVCGFYRERSHDIVALEGCLLGGEYACSVLAAVKRYMRESGVPPYDEGTHTGCIRRVFMRTARKTGEMMVVVSAAEAPQNPEELVRCIRAASGDITSIILNMHDKRSNAVLGAENKVLYGSPVIRDQLCGLWFEISPHSFFQVNPVQTERLYETAMEYAGLSPADTVLDIYCGIGTISLLAAKRCKEVIGVEIVPQAIADAEQNAARNGIGNARFYASDAQKLVPKLLEGGVRPDVVLLDPPRKGSDEQTLAAVVQSGAGRIVYVSCNPATLARDVRFLTGQGYVLERVAGVDMFPWTTHVETVVLMSRTEK